jgi:hypothetical protein
MAVCILAEIRTVHLSSDALPPVSTCLVQHCNNVGGDTVRRYCHNTFPGIDIMRRWIGDWVSLFGKVSDVQSVTSRGFPKLSGYLKQKLLVRFHWYGTTGWLDGSLS